MELQESPLLSDEDEIDINDDATNENYSKELNKLYNEIREDLRSLDSKDSGKVSEDSLLNYLKSKIPLKRKLNISLFQNFFKDLERDENSNICFDDFVKKYIQAYEELKLNFDILKKCLDKDFKSKNSLKEKIRQSKNEKINKNGISENSCVITHINEVTMQTKFDKNQREFYSCEIRYR